MATQEPVLFANAARSGEEMCAAKASKVEQTHMSQKNSCFAYFRGSKLAAQSEDSPAVIAVNSCNMPHNPAVAFWNHCSPVAIRNLCSGWNENVHNRLQAAIQKVIDQNPIFTGKLVQKKSSLCVLPGCYKLKDLFFVTEGPSVLMPSGTLERVKFMHQVLGPYFKADLGTGLQQLAVASPVFRMEVLTLPDGMACINFAISHSLVDGAGFHHVITLINDALQEKDITPMKWGVVEQQFRKRNLKDARFFVLPATWVELAKQKLTRRRLSLFSFVVDAEKCADLKKSLKRDSPYLSTNDVVVAALAEVLPGRTIVPKSTRKKVPGIDAHMGGNHFIAVGGRFAGDPVAVRKAVDVAAEEALFILDLVMQKKHIVSNMSFFARFEGAGLVTEVRCGSEPCDRPGRLWPGAFIMDADRETTLVTCTMDAKDLARGKLLSHLVRH
mmetsp:Transcript_136517/g.265546  ORF Transcript_136517/g.265546 Transcript_136517/m.265546 type:complete len:442 (-) Transcript_136517:256-1581(-)